MMNAIKMPNGAAGEYAKYACNFFTGCSCGCTYCYNRRWKWGDVPALKKCFKSEEHALEVFEKELIRNIYELQKHGLFFTFTSDPMLPETIGLTEQALGMCRYHNIPVKILTKRTDWVEEYLLDFHNYMIGCGAKGEMVELPNIAFGFTLTGHDDLEPHASTNLERIRAAQKLKQAGFKVWFSIEPIICLKKSYQMLQMTRHIGDLYKIGLKSGRKYNKEDLKKFVNDVIWHSQNDYKIKVYFKDNLLAQAGISREKLPANCVSRDYNMFNH